MQLRSDTPAPQTHSGPSSQVAQVGERAADRDRSACPVIHIELMVRVFVREPAQTIADGAGTPVAVLEHGGVVHLPAQSDKADRGLIECPQRRNRWQVEVVPGGRENIGSQPASREPGSSASCTQRSDQLRARSVRCQR